MAESGEDSKDHDAVWPPMDSSVICLLPYWDSDVAWPGHFSDQNCVHVRACVKWVGRRVLHSLTYLTPTPASDRRIED